MSTRRETLLVLAAAGAVVAVGAYASSRLYFGPAAKLKAGLAADRTDIDRFKAAFADRGRTSQALRAIGATTLGATEEVVDAALRERLNAIAAGAGLAAIQVETSRPAAEANPAGRVRVRGQMGRELRKGTDFWVVRGSVSGQGTLEQALRTLAAVQAQPWAHRVDSFSIKPEGKERERFEIRIGVATLMLPDQLGPGFTPPPVSTVSESEALALGPIVAKNVFRQPPPDQAVAHRPVVPAIPRSPYVDWKLTGIVEAGRGIEAWMVNTRSNERMTLPVGGTVADARLLAAAGERAVFEIGGKRFEVFNGQTLEQRRPTD